jgi:UDP-2-acetamido-2-deoxy-ribo-hexuluronate aminotransferase
MSNLFKTLMMKPGNEIKMIDLYGQYLKIKSEVDQSIGEVIKSSAFINGEAVKTFAGELAEYSGSKHVIPCGNGTDALQITYMALGLQRGDEVLIPAFNYVAAAEAAALLGLKPVFVDVWEDSFNINENLIEGKITSATKAIVAVHLFGQSANMRAIMDIAGKYNLAVIEDNAQSLGCEYIFPEGVKKKTGTIGNIGINSFFPTKNLGCFGDGGAIFTNDQNLAVKADKISKHGQGQKYSYEIIGCNSRLDTIQAAVLRVKLPYLEEYISKRIEAGKTYDELLENVNGVSKPGRKEYSTYTFNQYVIRIQNRDRVQERLKELGIPSIVYYPSPLHLQKAYKYLGYRKGDFPISEKLCKEVLALPLHTEITKEQQEYIIHNLAKSISII